MKLGTLIRLRDRQSGREGKDSTLGSKTIKTLPDVERLWELLDRNINVDVWKKGI